MKRAKVSLIIIAVLAVFIGAMLLTGNIKESSQVEKFKINEIDLKAYELGRFDCLLKNNGTIVWKGNNTFVRLYNNNANWAEVKTTSLTIFEWTRETSEVDCHVNEKVAIIASKV